MKNGDETLTRLARMKPAKFALLYAGALWACIAIGHVLGLL